MIEGQSCGMCVHFYPVAKEGEGQCRRDPPTSIVVYGEALVPILETGGKIANQRRPTNQIKAAFPPMLASDPGCGEFNDGDNNV